MNSGTQSTDEFGDGFSANTRRKIRVDTQLRARRLRQLRASDIHGTVKESFVSKYSISISIRSAAKND